MHLGRVALGIKLDDRSGKVRLMCVIILINILRSSILRNI